MKAEFTLYPTGHKFAGRKDYDYSTYDLFIAACNDIVRSGEYGYMNGALIDLNTAGVISRVDNAFEPPTRARTRKMYANYYSINPSSAKLILIDTFYRLIDMCVQESAARN